MKKKINVTKETSGSDNATDIIVDSAPQSKSINNDDDDNIDNIIMITNGLGKKPYTIKGVIRFNVASDDNDNAIIQGTLTSEFFVEESDDIYQVGTWRFCLNHVSVKMLECTSESNSLVYHFVANSFSIKA